MHPQVDLYLSKAEKWRAELERLRTIMLDCDLTEELKWGVPCYTFRKKNVVVIGELKDACVLSFFKGALLEDAHNILTKPGDNTQSAHVIRFTNVPEIIELESVLKTYIYEAIEVEKAGLQVDFAAAAALPMPEEFQRKLAGMPALKAAFEALTPGRQRAYLLHFSAPKQAKTRTARVENSLEQILRGKGLNE